MQISNIVTAYVNSLQRNLPFQVCAFCLNVLQPTVRAPVYVCLCECASTFEHVERGSVKLHTSPSACASVLILYFCVSVAAAAANLYTFLLLHAGTPLSVCERRWSSTF